MFENILNKIKGNKSIAGVKTTVNRLRSDPYASVKFTYQAARVVVILVSLVIAYQIISLVINFHGGSSGMTLIYRIIFLVIGVIIIVQIYLKVLNPMKKNLDHYEATPETQTTHFVDVDKEVDDIIAHFDNKKKEKPKQ
jgi:hypothetical protein